MLPASNGLPPATTSKNQKNNSPEGHPGWVCLLAEREREFVNTDVIGVDS